jgi:hypothetical protein
MWARPATLAQLRGAEDKLWDTKIRPSYTATEAQDRLAIENLDTVEVQVREREWILVGQLLR